MNTEQPPVVDPHASAGLPPSNPVNLARLGLRLALIPPVVIVLMLLLQPG